MISGFLSDDKLWIKLRSLKYEIYFNRHSQAGKRVMELMKNKKIYYETPCCLAITKTVETLKMKNVIYKLEDITILTREQFAEYTENSTNQVGEPLFCKIPNGDKMDSHQPTESHETLPLFY